MDPNVQPNLGNTPVVNVPTPNSGPKIKKVVLIIFLLILTVLIGVSGYFVFSKNSFNLNNSKDRENQGLNVPEGFLRAQELISDGGDLISTSLVRLSYTGILKSKNSGLSWTLEKGGNTVTIENISGGEVVYSEKFINEKSKRIVSESDLKIGDLIYLTVWIDINTGIVSVKTIEINNKAGVEEPISSASPSATP